MKLIIDIPEELKQKIDEGFTNQVIIGKLWTATRNGTPLVDLRTEIETLDINCHVVYAIAIDDVLKIFDKYIKRGERANETDN